MHIGIMGDCMDCIGCMGCIVCMGCIGCMFGIMQFMLPAACKVQSVSRYSIRMRESRNTMAGAGLHRLHDHKPSRQFDTCYCEGRSLSKTADRRRSAKELVLHCWRNARPLIGGVTMPPNQLSAIAAIRTAATSWAHLGRSAEEISSQLFAAQLQSKGIVGTLRLCILACGTKLSGCSFLCVAISSVPSQQ